MDWGLGHATRSIPLIRTFLKQGHEVIIASDGRALSLLRLEFPDLECRELPSYGITYRSSNMVWNIALQMPRITYAAFAELSRIRKWHKEQAFDAVVSDNRFGCFLRNVPSFFLTHQINLPIDNPIAAFPAKMANRFWLSRYDEVWVPDVEGEPNISGKLSRPSPYKKTRYLGPLTRMKAMDVPKEYDIVAVLSGPEPQRTFLEEILMEQLSGLAGNHLIIQGKTEEKTKERISPNLERISYMTSEDLNRTLCSSEFIITRSGYSTLMDLSVLGKKALLIPTPGQSEQEYLARHFHDQRVFMMQEQDSIDVNSAWGSRKEISGILNIGTTSSSPPRL